ncbi:hypothetical protein ACB098_09G093900 [Castanea mollissima]
MVRLVTFCAMLLGVHYCLSHVEKFHLWITDLQDKERERLEKKEERRRARAILQEAKKRDPLP